MHETLLHAELRGSRTKNSGLLDVLSRSEFMPRSSLSILEEGDGKFRLNSTIELSVAVDLPEVPRATVRIANAAGSAVLRSVCARTSKQRLREIERAYYEWEASQSTLPTEGEPEVTGKVIPSAQLVPESEASSYTSE